MGCGNSKPDPYPQSKKQGKRSSSRSKGKKQAKETIHFIPDKHHTMADVQQELREHGFDAASLVIGVDATKSNLKSGLISFDGHSLHDTSWGRKTPYEEAIEDIGECLADFDDDGQVPAYFFGGKISTGRGLTSFMKRNKECPSFRDALTRYRQIIPHLELKGPTTFKPLIDQTINLVIESGYQYHVLIIVADGLISRNCMAETQEAIIRASHYPMSIIMIGVGDGPFDKMQEFDDNLKAYADSHGQDYKFDNFQFVNFNKVMEFHETRSNDDDFEISRNAYFALMTMMEVPTQFMHAADLGLSGENKATSRKVDVDIHDPPSAAGDLPKSRSRSNVKVTVTVSSGSSSSSSLASGYGDSSGSGSSSSFSSSEPPAYTDVAL